MILTLGDMSYPFEPCSIKITERDIINVFQHKDTKMSHKKTLYETVSEVKKGISPNKYAKLMPRVMREYSEYLDYPIGQFLLILKDKGDSFYKSFLYKFGDEAYCMFSITDSSALKKKGLYAYCLDGSLMYIGKVTKNRDYKKRINTEYGKIDPKNCYLDGQNTNVRLNAIINAAVGEITFFVCPMEDDKLIEDVEDGLRKKYKPSWNIA